MTFYSESYNYLNRAKLFAVTDDIKIKKHYFLMCILCKMCLHI